MAEPMAEALPLLLGGPMLRRTDDNAVYVWLALSRRLELDGVVLRFNVQTGMAERADQPLGSGTPLFMEQVGRQLFIALVKIVALPAIGSRYPEQQILAYDIRMTELGRKKSILGEAKRLLLDGFALPTFSFASSRAADARILHGSCRKLHAGGRDPLLAAREQLEANKKIPGQRYSAFFLTGDQIYADDVSAFLSPVIDSLGAQLMGDQELPLPVAPEVLRKYSNERHDLLKDKAGFSTDEGEQHLMTLADFAAAYLLSWNAGLWPSDAALEQRAKALFQAGERDEIVSEGRGAPRTLGRAQNNALRQRLKEELANLLASRRSADALACIAANTATYMIFDDHEVTDDWNLNQAWMARLRGPAAALGRRIIANALAAYWLFQAIGNTPQGEGQPLRPNDVAERIRAYGAGVKDAGPRYDGLFERWTWSFAVKSMPPVLFLDTRTRRDSAAVTSIRKNGGATAGVGSDTKLLDQAARDTLAAWIKELKGPLAIIVSPVPVLTFSFLELLQNWVGRQGQVFMELVDNEGWHSNPEGYQELVGALLQFCGEQIIFLSGDLHFGYLRDARIEREEKTLHLLQCTSSAIRNQAPALVRRVIESSYEKKMMHGARTWWKPKLGAIAVLDDPATKDETDAVEKDFGKQSFHERSSALALSGGRDDVPAAIRDAALFANHMGLLAIQAGGISHTFLFEDEGKTGKMVYRYRPK
jgi:hypothetical protein